MAKAKQDIVQRNHLGQDAVVVPEGSDIPKDLKFDEKTGVAKPDPAIDRDELDGMTREQLNMFAITHGISDADTLDSKDDVVAAIRKADLA